MTLYVKIVGNDQIMFSMKEVYGHIFGQNVINVVNFCHFGENCQIWVILAYFGGQNDIICQNFGKMVK